LWEGGREGGREGGKTYQSEGEAMRDHHHIKVLVFDCIVSKIAVESGEEGGNSRVHV